ncbi:hypothetical protein B0H63DRAFT_489118 [Podospora didyma]|uniref:Protein kinase domain-containing protein n=1 Tax=Podospora didyma TaxID=330526 RepID=A0AAE0K2A3_9PEZI|nr:hypothetical protein B0H63DRAFT_489118 [Podospora didyma]
MSQRAQRRSRWSEPPDPERPKSPYQRDFTVVIKKHNPPPPFGNNFYPATNDTRKQPDDAFLYTATQTELVLAHPPQPRPSPPVPATATLKVIEMFKSPSDGRNAQVLICNITLDPVPGGKPYTAVAKIFDPLYYQFRHDLAPKPVDVTRAAEIDYAREAAAYQSLKSMGEAGSSAPQYYSSWIFELTFGYKRRTYTRPVCLVLMEYVDGACMLNLFVRHDRKEKCGPGVHALHYDEKYRIDVLGLLLDGITRQEHGGVVQNDCGARNIIIVPPPFPSSAGKAPSPPRRVVLIDYNYALVDRETTTRPNDLPRNPMDLFWDRVNFFYELRGWVPDEWDRNDNLFRRWLKDYFGGGRSQRYGEITRALEFDPEKKG